MERPSHWQRVHPNPNQLRNHGVTVNDNPYDRATAMGIELEHDEHIPFYSQGSTIFFTSRYPSDEELECYPHVVLTCDKPWDPNGLVMPGGMDDTGHPYDDRVVQRCMRLTVSRFWLTVIRNSSSWNAWSAVYTSPRRDTWRNCNPKQGTRSTNPNMLPLCSVLGSLLQRTSLPSPH